MILKWQSLFNKINYIFFSKYISMQMWQKDLKLNILKMFNAINWLFFIIISYKSRIVKLLRYKCQITFTNFIFRNVKHFSLKKNTHFIIFNNLAGHFSIFSWVWNLKFVYYDNFITTRKYFVFFIFTITKFD